MSLLHICTSTWYTEHAKTIRPGQPFPKTATINLTACMHIPTPHWVNPSPWSGLALWWLQPIEYSKSHVLRILRSKHGRTDSFCFLLLGMLTQRTTPLRMQTPHEKSNLATWGGHRKRTKDPKESSSQHSVMGVSLLGHSSPMQPRDDSRSN